LCAVTESLRQFWMQDNHFFSLLEGSQWLHIVSLCLCKATEAAGAIQRDETVVLQGILITVYIYQTDLFFNAISNKFTHTHTHTHT